MPTLPSLGMQILRGINGRCKDCGASIDKRSSRCRRCNIGFLMSRRYPLEERPVLTCIDCGTKVSYQSQNGHGRCRPCYSTYRVSNPKPKRSAIRFSGGTYNEDEEGHVLFTDEYHESEEFTVGSAWGAMRRCWKGFKIAKSQDDWEKMVEYAKAIQHLQGILDISRTEFPDLLADEYESQYPTSETAYDNDEWYFGKEAASSPSFTCPSHMSENYYR